VAEALKKQLECGTVLGGPTELEIKLSEKILKDIPSGDQVLFCASGTEANMVGLRAIRAFTGKDKILRCKGSYHGSSDSFVEGEGVPKDVLERTVSVPFNDIESFENAVKDFKHELAGVFMEPVMRGIPPRDQYLQRVRKITEQNGVLLIFDEVVTGYRLACGGAQRLWRIKPDMTLLGKLIGGGIPIGAVVSSDKILAPYRSNMISGLTYEEPAIIHGGTFNAHPLAMAGGLATLDELTDDAYVHLNNVGERLRAGMRKILKKVGVQAQVIGIGSIFHIYFTEKHVNDSTSAKSANKLLQRLYDLNMIVRGIFPAKSHCSFTSTPVSDAEVEKTLDAFADTIESMKPTVQQVAPQLA
jgi:glutamate-1-semialdehyde 2,1-aminomutase